MENYSLDIEAQNICIPKTKEYFREVLSSYHNRNYRATIVLLYSIVICDLVYKLEDLKDLYNDKNAEGILKEIESVQKKNPKSPDWEKQLINLVKDKTKLFDVGLFANIIALQNLRHLCAHPVLDMDYNLYQPNRDTARAYIRNILQGLLIKSPFLSNNVFEVILNDISGQQNLFISKSEFERYIEAKYFKNIDVDVSKNIFKKLWKFVFRLNDKKCSLNRRVNYWTLEYVYRKWNHNIIKDIEDDINYYSRVEIGGSSKYLIHFIAKNEFIYDRLDDQAKLIISKQIENDEESQILSWFTSNSFNEHIKLVESIMENRDPWHKDIGVSFIDELIQIGIEKGFQQDCIKFCIERYIGSFNFNQANEYFFRFIAPYIDIFSLDEVLSLIQGIESNGQVRCRNKAFDDHKLIYDLCNEKYSDEIDFTEFSLSFKNYLEE